MKTKYDLKKEDIVKDARKAFLEFGYKKTTMDDIAGKLRLRKNTLYYYFKSKEDLFNEVVDNTLLQMIDRIKQAIGKADSAEAKTKICLKIFANEIRNSLTDTYTTPAILVEFICVMGKKQSRVIENLPLILSGILKEGVRNGEFVQHNADELAIILLETTISYEITHQSKISHDLIDKDDKNSIYVCNYHYKKGLEYMLNGIKTKSKQLKNKRTE